MWTESEEGTSAPVGLNDLLTASPDEVQALTVAEGSAPLPPKTATDPRPLLQSVEPTCLISTHGWPIPSTICPDPDEARARIQLPAFSAALLDRARGISERYPAAEGEYRHLRRKEPGAPEAEIPHFEKVFRIAAAMAGVPNSCEYDELLILTAWQCVRPGMEGFLGSYPKSLLCPLSHAASPGALDGLSPAKRLIFERRAPIYLRYLILEKFALRTCAALENADLRLLLKSTGFRLIRPSAVPEVAFIGITRGEDPPVRPWKLALRQELSDERAAEMLIQAALWQIKYGLRLVSTDSCGRVATPFATEEARETVGNGVATLPPRWNIGEFGRTDWEDAFLSLGVRVPPSLMRESGLLDWRAVLARCLQEIGTGNLPPEVVGKVSAQPQRICHDSNQAIWDVLDRAARTVLERARVSEPGLFTETGELNRETARSFRRWARLFDEVSPNILSRFGVSAFTALHRVAPAHFGWGPAHLKPWELEQEHGKWKGPRGRALLRSAYAFALYEAGLGCIETQQEQVVWHCTREQFAAWSARKAKQDVKAYDFLYAIASRHGLTPLLSREVTHTAAVSLLAGMNLHDHLPTIEGCWDVCMRAALDLHGGKLEVHLVIPDLVPLPLRLRKAVLASLTYTYLHKGIRLVRDFDLRMARESHRKLEELPGWWEDERIVGTPLFGRVTNTTDPARAVLATLRHEPWQETRRMRFRALHLLTARNVINRRDVQIPTSRETTNDALSSEEIRVLLRLASEVLEHTNIAQVSIPAIARGFDRLLAREDTREMLESLLMHVGTAYETELWGQVRRFIVLDAINDLVALAIRSSLSHLNGGE